MIVDHDHMCNTFRLTGSAKVCDSRGFCVCECGAERDRSDFFPAGEWRPPRTEPTIAQILEEDRNSETVLEEAQRLVHGNRGADYGHPIVDYERTGRIWGALLGIPDIDPRICCLMMVGVKLSREVNKHKRDNLTDAAGYAECASMVAEKQAEKSIAQ